VLEGTNRWLLYAAWNLRLIAFGDASLKDPFGRKPCVQIALDDLDLSQQESWVQFAAPHPINECGLDNKTDVPDLLEFPSDCHVVVEGFRLLPDRVKPLLDVPKQGVWLLPTPEFRRAAFESRGGLWTIAGKTSDPERGLRNLLVRDGLFTERLREEARMAGLSVIEVTTSVTEDALADRVAEQFGLARPEPLGVVEGWTATVMQQDDSAPSEIAVKRQP
jgi:hypothetical protein